MMNKVMNTEGFALVGTVLVIALLTVLGGAAYLSSILEARMSSNTKSTTEAFYVAEGGLQRALGELAKDSTWARSVSDSSDAFSGDNYLGEAQYVVEVFDDQPQSGFVIIRSTGNVYGTNPASATVEITAQKGGDPIFPAVFDYGVFTCNNLDYTGGGNTINGDVFAGGNFTMKGGTNDISGSVRATGNLAVKDDGQISGSVWGNGDVKAECDRDPCIDGSATAGGNVSGEELIAGEVNADVSPEPVADLCDPTLMHDRVINREQIQSFMDDADTVLDGNQTFQNESVSYTGIVHMTNGDLHLNGEILLSDDVIFIVENGNVDLGGPGSIKSNPPGAQVTFLILNGNLHVNGSMEIDGVVQVGSVDEGGSVTGGNIHVQDGANFKINGTAAALNGNFHISEGVTINHSTPADERLAIGGSANGGAKMTAWREIRY